MNDPPLVCLWRWSLVEEKLEPLETLLPVTAAQLKVVQLLINEAKTEFTHAYLAETKETNDDGNPLRGMEEWRKSQTLGSLICSYDGIAASCTMGNIAFRYFKKPLDTWKEHPPKNETLPLHCDVIVHHAVQLQQLHDSS